MLRWPLWLCQKIRSEKKIRRMKWQLNWFSDKSVIPSLTSNFVWNPSKRLKRCVMLTNRKWWISFSSKLCIYYKAMDDFFRCILFWIWSPSRLKLQPLQRVCACVCVSHSPCRCWKRQASIYFLLDYTSKNPATLNCC